MIPQSTTLAERLEFYEWALEEVSTGRKYFLCHIASIKYEVDTMQFKPINLKKLFPELYKFKKESTYSIILWSSKEQRIEALQKAIIEVKRKIEEDEIFKNNL